MPPRLTAQDFDQELLILFDAYVHGALDQQKTHADFLAAARWLKGRADSTGKDGEQTIGVAPGTPIVTFRPADRSLLVPGASVSLTARLLDEVPTAERISAGRNGFALPY